MQAKPPETDVALPLRHRVAHASLKGAARLIASLPAGALPPVARCLGGLHGGVIRHRRGYVRDTLERCFPDKPPEERRRILTGMYQCLSLNQLELLRAAGGRDEELAQRFDVSGREHVEAARAAGNGVLILTAHLGNWDLMAILASRCLGYPLVILSKDMRNPGVNAFWMEARRNLGVRILPSKGSYRNCLRTLRANELLAFILDVNRPGRDGVFVDFFGRPASTSPGLAHLSAVTGAPVVPVYMHRLPDGRHHLEAHPAFAPPPDRSEEAILNATQRYTRSIEDAVRRYPEQWLWLHKRWKNQPPPDGAPAAS